MSASALYGLGTLITQYYIIIIIIIIIIIMIIISGTFKSRHPRSSQQNYTRSSSDSSVKIVDSSVEIQKGFSSGGQLRGDPEGFFVEWTSKLAPGSDDGLL